MPNLPNDPDTPREETADERWSRLSGAIDNRPGPEGPRDPMSPSERAELELLSAIDEFLARDWSVPMLGDFLSSGAQLTEDDLDRLWLFHSTVDSWIDSHPRIRAAHAARVLAHDLDLAKHEARGRRFYVQNRLWELEFLARPQLDEQLRAAWPPRLVAMLDQEKAIRRQIEILERGR